MSLQKSVIIDNVVFEDEYMSILEVSVISGLLTVGSQLEGFSSNKITKIITIPDLVCVDSISSGWSAEIIITKMKKY